MNDEGLTNGQLKVLTDAFNTVDRENTGHVNTRDIRTVLQLMGQCPTQEDMDQYMNILEEHETITCQELRDFVTRNVEIKNQESLNEELMTAFSTFDSIKDGFVSMDEFRAVMTSRGTEPLTDEQADTLLNMVETHSNGRINVTELTSMFSTVH